MYPMLGTYRMRSPITVATTTKMFIAGETSMQQITVSENHMGGLMLSAKSQLTGHEGDDRQRCWWGFQAHTISGGIMFLPSCCMHSPTPMNTHVLDFGLSLENSTNHAA